MVQCINKDMRIWQMKRYLIVALAFFGFLNLYTMRTNLSVAIVAMTDKSRADYDTIYEWTFAEKGLILSSFFYGYVFPQLIGGFVATRFGGNLIFGGGIFVASIACVLTPLIVHNFEMAGLITIRVIQGIAQGFSYPSCHALFAKWAPENEKSRMISLTVSGSYIGAVVANMLSGYLSANFGWASIFYVFGIMGIVWYILWALIVRKSPQDDHLITKQEKEYILNRVSKNVHEKLVTPWFSIFTSIPVWAIVVAHFSFSWVFYTFLTQLPAYLRDALQYELDTTGFVGALPYLTMGITMPIAGYLGDWIMNRELMSVAMIRKTFTFVAFIIQAALLVVLAFTTDPTLCVALITVAVTVSAFSSSGIVVSPIDIAPKYAGIIIALSNSIASIPGIVTPIITGDIVKDSTNIEEWRIVFFISAGFCVIGASVFAIFARGVIQRWAVSNDSKI